MPTKFDNREEMDKFLETFSPPKLNQEETDLPYSTGNSTQCSVVT